MSNDSFTEVTNQSFGSRIGGSIIGIGIGLLIFIISFPLLFWNEGRAVKRYKTLEGGAGSVISINADEIDPANEGRLVHLSGMAVTDDTLKDTEFGVSARTIRLIRAVKMYQWKEKKTSESKKKTGGGKKTTTTYSYAKDWHSGLINSSSFKKPEGHENPNSMSYNDANFMASQVTVGDFGLSRSFFSQISESRPYPIDADKATIPGNIQAKAQFSKGGIYVGANANSPTIGDMKIQFKVVKPAKVSVIGRQEGKQIVTHKAKHGEIELLKTGEHTAEVMFEQAGQKNKVMTWVLRFGGVLLMYLGLAMVFGPLSVLFDILPFLGNLVESGVKTISFLIAGALSFITIGVAWVAYRPMIAGILIGVALICAVGVIVLRKR